VLAAVLVGQMIDLRARSSWLIIPLSLFLVNNARPALFENWTRPLKGPHSLWTSSRDDDYFRDMGQFNNQAWFIESVDRVARSGCDLVGIDITQNALEYPFQALLLSRTPATGAVRAYRHTHCAGASLRGALPRLRGE